MKASGFVLVGLLIVVVALSPYIIGIGLAAAIVHQAAHWRREARQRSREAVAFDALRSMAQDHPVPYTGVLNPASSAWYDKAGR